MDEVLLGIKHVSDTALSNLEQPDKVCIHTIQMLRFNVAERNVLQQGLQCFGRNVVLIDTNCGNATQQRIGVIMHVYEPLQKKNPCSVYLRVLCCDANALRVWRRSSSFTPAAIFTLTDAPPIHALCHEWGASLFDLSSPIFRWRRRRGNEGREGERKETRGENEGGHKQPNQKNGHGKLTKDIHKVRVFPEREGLSGKR